MQILGDQERRQAYDAEQAHRRLLSEVAIADSLRRGEMEVDGESGELFHPCRCGGSFVLSPQEALGEQRSLVIPCDTCSLYIEVVC